MEYQNSEDFPFSLYWQAEGLRRIAVSLRIRQEQAVVGINPRFNAEIFNVLLRHLLSFLKNIYLAPQIRT